MNIFRPIYNLLFNYCFYLPCGGERLFRERCVEFANLVAEDRVIELCCGTGDLTTVIGSKGLIKELVAIDISEQAIKIARMRKLVIPVTFINASTEALPVDSSIFNKGIISFGFHHMPRNIRNLTMLETYRVLQPGGVLYVIDYNLPEKGMKRCFALTNAKIWFSLLRQLRTSNSYSSVNCKKHILSNETEICLFAEFY